MTRALSAVLTLAALAGLQPTARGGDDSAR